MDELIIVIITVVFLVLILSLLLYFITKKTNLLMKNKFIDNVSELDILIADKEKKVEDLNKNIADKEEKIKQLEDNNDVVDVKNSPKMDEISLPKYIDYEDDNLFQNYKLIKEKFNFDARNIIEKFIIENVSNDMTSFELYTRIRSYFTNNIIYKISAYSSIEQYNIINELLTADEKVVLKNIDSRKFNLKKFLEMIDSLIMQNDPYIRIFVGNSEINYNNINSFIKTIYDEKITEGFKIVYKGTVYDYSI